MAGASENDAIYQQGISSALFHEGDIGWRTRRCQELFKECAQTEPLAVEWLEKRQGMFNLWSFVLKASETGKQSLDHRVRTRPDIAKPIEDLLDGLQEALEQCLEIACQEQPVYHHSDDASDMEMTDWSEEDEDSEDDKDLQDPFAQQKFYITSIVDQLRRISIEIQMAGAKYRYEKADKELREDKFLQDFRSSLTATILIEQQRQVNSMAPLETGDGGQSEAEDDFLSNAESESRPEVRDEPAQTAELNVQALCEQLQQPSKQLTTVQDRLVQANILRRHRIRFLTERARIVQPASAKAQVRFQSIPQQRHDAGPLPSKPEEGTTAAPPRSRQSLPQVTPPPNPPSRRDGQSQPQTATAIPTEFDIKQVIKSKSSPSAATIGTRTGAGHEYPRCPKPAVDGREKGMIKCPYCAEILAGEYAHHKQRWRGHVARDLIPYVCVFEDCSKPDEMFPSTFELTRHMIKEHGRTYWVCDRCPIQFSGAIFETASNWQAHMRAEHPDCFLETELPLLCSASRQTLIPPVACPLCHASSDIPSETLNEHVADHLHAFALLSLPWEGDDSDRAKSDAASGARVLRSDLDEDEELEYPNTADAASLITLMNVDATP